MVFIPRCFTVEYGYLAGSGFALLSLDCHRLAKIRIITYIKVCRSSRLVWYVLLSIDFGLSRVKSSLCCWMSRDKDDPAVAVKISVCQLDCVVSFQRGMLFRMMCPKWLPLVLKAWHLRIYICGSVSCMIHVRCEHRLFKSFRWGEGVELLTKLCVIVIISLVYHTTCSKSPQSYVRRCCILLESSMCLIFFATTC